MFVVWSCWNTIFLVLLVQASSLIPTSALGRLARWLPSPGHLRQRLAAGGSYSTLDTLVMDLPWCVLFVYILGYGRGCQGALTACRGLLGSTQESTYWMGAQGAWADAHPGISPIQPRPSRLPTLLAKVLRLFGTLASLA